MNTASLLFCAAKFGVICYAATADWLNGLEQSLLISGPQFPLRQHDDIWVLWIWPFFLGLLRTFGSGEIPFPSTNGLECFYFYHGHLSLNFCWCLEICVPGANAILNSWLTLLVWLSSWIFAAWHSYISEGLKCLWTRHLIFRAWN